MSLKLRLSSGIENIWIHDRERGGSRRMPGEKKYIMMNSIICTVH
jgi:hypothetical protein